MGPTSVASAGGNALRKQSIRDYLSETVTDKPSTSPVHLSANTTPYPGGGFELYTNHDHLLGQHAAMEPLDKEPTSQPFRWDRERYDLTMHAHMGETPHACNEVGCGKSLSGVR